MRFLFSIIFISTCLFSQAQREHHFDLTYSHGKSIRSISCHIVKNFKLLKSEKLHFGYGGRLGVNYGTTTSYMTAPAKHTKSDDGIDTITVKKPQFINVNLSLNASYHFSPEWAAGFNFDLFGFTFGKKRDADFFPGLASQSEEPARTKLNGQRVKPEKNNIFLTGDRSKGTLLSEFFIRYTPVERFSIKAGYGITVTEYSSSNRIGHNNNYRFRNTQGQFLIGIGLNFI